MDSTGSRDSTLEFGVERSGSPASPDQRVRDGEKALIMAQGLVARVSSSYLEEALAMALAEIGDFESAARVAEEVLHRVDQSDPDFAGALRQEIASYQQGQPWRDPGDRLLFFSSWNRLALNGPIYPELISHQTETGVGS